MNMIDKDSIVVQASSALFSPAHRSGGPGKAAKRGRFVLG